MDQHLVSRPLVTHHQHEWVLLTSLACPASARPAPIISILCYFAFWALWMEPLLVRMVPEFGEDPYLTSSPVFEPAHTSNRVRTNERPTFSFS